MDRTAMRELVAGVSVAPAATPASRHVGVPICPYRR